MQFKKIAFLTLFLSIFFAACSDSKKEEKVLPQEKKVFRLIKPDGLALTVKKTDIGYSFEEFKGKAVLVNFFATWCPPCKAEIPHLNNLQEKYKDSFVIVSPLLEKGKDSVEIINFMKEFEINYNVSISSENYALAESFGGVKSIPTMYLLNKDGKIIQKYVGIVPEEMMEIDIKRAIK